MAKIKSLKNDQHREPNIDRRKKIINVRRENNKLYTHQKLKKIKESKNCFFEKINKVNKPLIRFTKKLNQLNVKLKWGYHYIYYRNSRGN